MKIRTTLAIALGIAVFPLMWVMVGLGLLNLPGEILGVTIAMETLILNFYFRKKTKTEDQI